MFKTFLKSLPLYYPLRKIKQWVLWNMELLKWKKAGCVVPPPHIVKQKVLKQYAKEYGLKILVETGTYVGDMCEAMKNTFDKIYSIELDQKLFEAARKRFKTCEHVEIIHGDSGKEIGRLISKLDKATLFFLDGHYSGGMTSRGEKDTPIFEELNSILRSWNGKHVIIIDDARCFGSDPAYPTLDELRKAIYSRTENIDFRVKDDIIRIVPINEAGILKCD